MLESPELSMFFSAIICSSEIHQRTKPPIAIYTQVKTQQLGLQITRVESPHVKGALQDLSFMATKQALVVESLRRPLEEADRIQSSVTIYFPFLRAGSAVYMI
jgi:hypothetical protein